MYSLREAESPSRTGLMAQLNLQHRIGGRVQQIGVDVLADRHYPFTQMMKQRCARSSPDRLQSPNG